jgi:molybdopterin-guanine dinucleotide biosynthesis protein A
MGGSGDVGEVTGVILAGGRARRFGGRNKATLELGGQWIVQRQLDALRPITAAQLIVANDAAPFARLGVPVTPDIHAGKGPLGGLHAALSVAATARALVLACDLPFVHTAFLRFLVERAREADIVVPRTAEGTHPLCAVYATRLAPVIAARIAAGRLAVHELFDLVPTVTIEPRAVAAFDPGGYLLSNVNTAAEYEAARALSLRMDDGLPPVQQR